MPSLITLPFPPFFFMYSFICSLFSENGSCINSCIMNSQCSWIPMNAWRSCLYLPWSGIPWGVGAGDWTQGLVCICWASTIPTELHPKSHPLVFECFSYTLTALDLTIVVLRFLGLQGRHCYCCFIAHVPSLKLPLQMPSKKLLNWVQCLLLRPGKEIAMNSNWWYISQWMVHSRVPEQRDQRNRKST